MSRKTSHSKTFSALPILAGATLVIGQVASVSAAQFTDVTAQSGLSNIQTNGAGWGDYNNDGCVDLLTSDISTGGLALMQNDCNGGFTNVAAAAGLSGFTANWAIVWADVNGDGNLDIYTSSSGLLINNGSGLFFDASTASGLIGDGKYAGATFADYDSDGDLDLFVASRFGGGLDLSDKLFRNDNGVFVDVAISAGVAGASDRLSFMGSFFDYDMDGDLDLYIAVDFGSDVLYRNEGDGTFVDVTVDAGINPPGHGMGLYVGDLNNDGCFDIVSSNNGRSELDDDEFADHGPTILYENQCDGTFEIASYAVGIKDRGVVEWGLNFIDYDNDADLDFSVVGGGMLTNGEANAFYENDGSGNLVEITDKAGVQDLGAAFGSIWADFDNDGDLDWFVGNHAGGESKLFRNDSVTGNYLKVKPVCSGFNVDCIGATVSIEAGSRIQKRIIQAGVSYAGSEELVAHFGTGIKQTVDSVTVQWPNGESSNLSNVDVNQTLVVEQIVEPVDPFGDIQGLVLTADDIPAVGARVLLREQGQRTAHAIAIVDSTGQFSFENIPTGDWEVLAILDNTSSPNTRFTIEPGELEELVLRLLIIR